MLVNDHLLLIAANVPVMQYGCRAKPLLKDVGVNAASDWVNRTCETYAY